MQARREQSRLQLRLVSAKEEHIPNVRLVSEHEIVDELQMLSEVRSHARQQSCKKHVFALKVKLGLVT